MKRTIAILSETTEFENTVEDNIKLLIENEAVDNIVVATTTPNSKWNIAGKIQCMNLAYPSICNTIPKKRNWLNKHFKSQNYDGFLYVLEDSVELNNCVVPFFSKLESMMTAMDYAVWFNTISDCCNYLYDKYVPRLAIEIDKPEFSKFGITKLVYTSHSNTSMIAYDFSRATDDQLTFNELFEVPMFYIIEYLARRRNNKIAGSLFYMNQYLTIPEEIGTFKTLSKKQSENSESFDMQKEDAIFKGLKINYSSDNNIDQILEQTYDKLKSKL